MNLLETKEAVGPGPAKNPRSPSPTPRRGWRLVKLVVLLLAASGVGLYVYAHGVKQSQNEATHALDVAKGYLQAASRAITSAKPPESSADASEIKPHAPWKGFVDVREDEAKAIGLQVVTVAAQSEPIRLELTGTTDYDPNTLTQIRPRFDTLVEHVHAELGQTVKAKDPLVDLFSTDLAKAKNDFQTSYVQWRHDQRLLELRKSLFEQNGAVSRQLYIDSQNDEAKSRLAFETGRENLRVLGVPIEQIDPLLKYLGDEPIKRENKDLENKARMTRVSPVDGIVIKRDVVPGNLYDNNDVLMVIAPLEHLFVWVNVYEKDLAKVFVGQHMEVTFPFLSQAIETELQYISPAVSKETRAIRIRATIPNVGGRLKADMRVRAALEIPPIKGQTVIPRLSMVVMGGSEYAFVRRPARGAAAPEEFERRKVVVAQERADQVVVASGLAPGEQVASSGSLILSQLYEDQQIVETGMPVK